MSPRDDRLHHARMLLDDVTGNEKRSPAPASARATPATARHARSAERIFALRHQRAAAARVADLRSVQSSRHRHRSKSLSASAQRWLRGQVKRGWGKIALPGGRGVHVTRPSSPAAVILITGNLSSSSSPAVAHGSIHRAALSPPGIPARAFARHSARPRHWIPDELPRAPPGFTPRARECAVGKVDRFVEVWWGMKRIVTSTRFQICKR